MKKSQLLSFDLMIAVVIFLTIFLLFLSFFMNRTTPSEEGKVEQEAKIILDYITSTDQDSPAGTNILIEQNVDMDALTELAKKIDETPDYYDYLKQQWGVESDFCIYFEGSNGEILPIPFDQNHLVYGIGDSRLNIKLGTNIYGEDVICGKKYSI